jgi:hypothetical protein
MAAPQDDSKIPPEKKEDANVPARLRPVHLPLLEVNEMREIEEEARKMSERSLQRLPGSDSPTDETGRGVEQAEEL